GEERRLLGDVVRVDGRARGLAGRGRRGDGIGSPSLITSPSFSAYAVTPADVSAAATSGTSLCFVVHRAIRHFAKPLRSPRPGALPQGTATVDRRTGDAGEGEGRLAQWVGRVLVRRLGEYPAPPQQAQDTGADRGDEPSDLGIGWRGGRVEAQPAVGGFGEHAFEHQRVGMNV